VITSSETGRKIPLGDRIRRYDYALALAAVLMGFIGVIIIYSATKVQLESVGVSGRYYMERQAIWVVIGVVVMVVVAAIDYRKLVSYGYVIYGLAFLGLAGVFVVGKSQLGSQRWYQLGPLQVQPSEFAPIAVIFALALYVERSQGTLTWKKTAAMIALAGVPMLLVIKQPDLGTGIVIGVIAAMILVVAGVPLRYLLVIAVVGVLGAVAVVELHILKTYQLDRLLSFLHPKSHLATTGYNLNESKIAIGSGGLFGTGLFKGSQTNLAFVPEQQTDFIFTAIGEQLGFIGSAVIVAGLGFIVWRIYRALALSHDAVERVLCVGALAWIGFSAFQNVGMTVGIMPITGIPLPFLSYGGSAAVAFFAAIGVVLNVGMQRVRLK